MSQVIKRENMTISIREYTDNQGQQKKVWKTIGELVTWDDGKQSFEMWGAGGSTKGSVFEQTERNDQNNNQQQNNQQQPQQQQGGYQQQQPQQNNNPNF
jgi:hypothetical protein